MTFGYMKKLKWVIILVLLAGIIVVTALSLRNITRPSEQEFSGMFIRLGVNHGHLHQAQEKSDVS